VPGDRVTAARKALLASIPEISQMQQQLRRLTMLDAILAPEFRAFEYHPAWGKGEELGAFKNGSGDFFFAWFAPAGAVLRGFDHESVMSPFQKDPPVIWPGLFDGLPAALAYANEEVAFALDEVTFCMWSNKASKGAWCEGTARRPAGKDPDGARSLLGCFQKDHRAWATEYYGEELDAGALARVWQEREPIDRATLEALNPEHDLATVREEAKALGWKTSGLGGRARK
jgi:hypothetical protein